MLSTERGLRQNSDLWLLLYRGLENVQSKVWGLAGTQTGILN